MLSQTTRRGQLEGATWRTVVEASHSEWGSTRQWRMLLPLSSLSSMASARRLLRRWLTFIVSLRLCIANPCTVWV